jgi:hypothetical protein
MKAPTATPDDHSLPRILERFNRKERDALVKTALGVNRPALGRAFRKVIAAELGLERELPATAWWSIDFHISWLAGALAVYREQAVSDVPRPNTEGFDPQGGRYALVEGNQEDVDLVIATSSDLIFIEAKGSGGWDKRQLESKFQRLNQLYEEHRNAGVAHPATAALRFHVLLTSPAYPGAGVEAMLPVWARKASPFPWVPLRFDGSPLRVSRCDLSGRIAAAPDYWRIVV